MSLDTDRRPLELPRGAGWQWSEFPAAPAGNWQMEPSRLPARVYALLLPAGVPVASDGRRRCAYPTEAGAASALMFALWVAELEAEAFARLTGRALR